MNEWAGRGGETEMIYNHGSMLWYILTDHTHAHAHARTHTHARTHAHTHVAAAQTTEYMSCVGLRG